MLGPLSEHLVPGNLKPEPRLGLPGPANQKAPIVLKLRGFLSLAKK